MNLQEINTQLDHLSSQWSDFATKASSAIHRPEAALLIEDKSFTNYLRKGDISGLETKSLSSVNEEGGFMISPAMHNKIITGLSAKSPMRRVASIETISTSALDVIIEDGEFASGWVADKAERPETETPKVLQKRIMVHELYAQPKATQRLIDDSAINIDQWLSERLEDSFLAAENKSFFSGNGENQPKGILSYSDEDIEQIPAMEDGKLHIDDILNLINEMDEDYLGNATFFMHRTTLSMIQKLKDETKQLIWQPSISASVPDHLFGIPVICSSDMPKFEQKKLVIALGDFKRGYKIVDRQGIAMMRDPYTEKPFVKFYGVKRVGGDVVDTDAIKFLKL